MIVGIMQPYFMPYISYFQLMKAVDKYVVYDDVNYIKGGWVSRNNIVVNGEKKMFTIMLRGASPNKLFNEIEIGDDFRKLMRTLELNYSKASHYNETMALLENIVSFSNRQLSLFIANSFRQILSYLDINTEILISSGLPKNCSLRGVEKVMDICHLLQANEYYNAIGGEELYDKKKFEKQLIKLSFIKTITQNYPQSTKEFIPNLSIIDVLMNNSVESVNELLDNYKLI